MHDTCPYTEPMTRSEVKSLEGYLYFVWEREAMRLARANDFKPPYTSDPVLAKYKFTNIRRRDDRVSQWVLHNLIIPNEERTDLWFMLLVARLINWPPTLTMLLDLGLLPKSVDEFQQDYFVAAMEEWAADGKKSFSGAYMVYPTRLSPGRSKAFSISEHILKSAQQNASLVRTAIDHQRIEVVVDALTSCFGVSTFMAGQVAADLSYTPKQLGLAADLYDFAPLGPGSQRGLNYVLGLKPTKVWGQDDFNLELQVLDRAIQSDLGIDDLTLHDVQNTLCEYGKYAAYKVDGVRPKNSYKPETEF
jgi:hypothetical protein